MKVNKLKYLIDFIKIKKAMINKSHFFFFPFYHIGGAERVHLDILEVFDKKNSICFITNNSMNNYFYEEFKSKTTLIEIEKLTPKYKQKLINLIVKHINKKNKSLVFGCNSHLFYDLIPNFKDTVKIIDLIHAFSYEEPYAAEKYSLPVVEKINNRIILGKKTFFDFEKLYFENDIHSKNLDQIKIIKNKVEVPEQFLAKPYNKNLKILFVGRNSSEKRPEIFFEIAKKCLDLKLSVEFTVIGDFDLNLNASQNVSIIGLIHDKSLLNDYYQNSDLLLITSSREGFPMVVLEGMAHGVVPICTNVGEISEFINSENQNGFIISNNQEVENIVQDFVKQIETLENNGNILSSTSLNAYQSVKSNFSITQFSESYKKLLKNK